MQDLLTPRLTPHALLTAFSVSEMSVFDNKYQKSEHNMSRMCACLRRLRYCTNEYSPEGTVIVVESRKCNATDQNTPFMFQRAPEKSNNKVQVPTIDKHPLCVILYQIYG